MTANENELITLIRDHNDPEQALKIALDLMICLLGSREAPQDRSSETHRATA